MREIIPLLCELSEVSSVLPIWVEKLGKERGEFKRSDRRCPDVDAIVVVELCCVWTEPRKKGGRTYSRMPACLLSIGLGFHIFYSSAESRDSQLLYIATVHTTNLSF